MGGKHVDHEASGLNENQNHPEEYKWSIFHVLKYHKWQYVRKKNPHKRTKNETPENDSHPPDASRSAECKDAEKVEEKASKSGGSKQSVKARIKALITDDKHKKKKGKHHRTASVPHLDSHVEPDKDPDKQQIGNVDEKLDIADQTSVQHKLTEEEELKKDTSESESKEALEALNIINLNKESLMKILHNQNSPMVHHVDGKIRNSNSFSSANRSSRGFGLLKFNSMRESLPQAAEYKKDGVFRRSRSVADNPSSPSAVHLLKKSGESQSVSRFKGLKKKIKQVLKESRKDKQRITMDAVLHKVPPGNKFSKETKKEVSEHLKHPVLSGDGKHSPKAGRPQHIKRTSSLSESMDKYCQLYEATNKEINHHGSERERPKPITEETGPPNASQKNFARNFSLPDLQYYSYQNESSSDAFSASIKAATESYDNAKHRLDEKKGVEDSKVEENSVESVEVNSHSPAASNDGNAEKGLHIDDSGSLGEEDGTSEHERDIELRGKPSLKLEELSSLSKPDVGFEDDLTISTGELEPIHFPLKEIESLPDQQQKPMMDTPKTTDRIGKVEIPSKKIHDIPRLRVEENNRAEFQYVRDVLELSGFSGTEALGEWHADDQPLDPCMYDEVEGYLVLEPECCENEGSNSHQLVLFDVINEVLMDIYERACSYIPRRLSSVCHTHHLPRGHHVLEEVWEEVRWYLSFKPEPDQLVEYVVARDLSKNAGWMNLQSDSECVGLELESLIFDDILDEAIWE